MEIWRSRARSLLAGLIILPCYPAKAAPDTYSPPARYDHPTQVFWGDTHLHTNLSGDAVFRLGPDAAYRCAKIVDPGSARLSEKARIIEWIEKIRRGGR